MASLGRLGTILLEGFLLTLPVLLVYLMLGGVVDGMLALTAPIADFLPMDWFEDAEHQRLIAAVLLVVLFLVVGLAAQTAPMQSLGVWIENRTLNRFPPYAILKSLSQGIGGKDQEHLRPALLSVAPDSRMLVAVVEELPNDQVCVFVPMAPTPAVGFLQIVPSSKVERLDVPMSDALGSILNWGAGTGAVLKATPSPSATPRAGS